MNMDEFLKKIEAQNPGLAHKLRELALDQLIQDALRKGAYILAAQLRKRGSSGLESPDLARLNVDFKYRLEKFEGDYSPGMTPFEVLEGSG